jgi:hypothetical protein
MLEAGQQSIAATRGGLTVKDLAELIVEAKGL